MKHLRKEEVTGMVEETGLVWGDRELTLRAGGGRSSQRGDRLWSLSRMTCKRTGVDGAQGARQGTK